MTWRMLDLFSGIGGFSLAAQWCWGDELEIVSFVENDNFCQQVLRRHWPKTPIYDDICTFGKKGIDGTINLLTGGFPCQPFSIAGHKRGKDDDRFLWPQMFRVIKETKPDWIVGENVAHFVRMELHTMLSDLETEGYEVCPLMVPACAVGAPHRRERIWILANTGIFSRNGGNCLQNLQIKTARQTSSIRDENGKFVKMASLDSESIQGSWTHQPPSNRVVDGIPNQLDRLKSLGNAIVPQVAYQIFKAIKEIEYGNASNHQS